MRLLNILILSLILTMAGNSFCQVRFYNQFKTIPFRKGSSNSFDVLVGAKIDPNKEIVLGLGLAGTYNSRTFVSDISFNQKSATISYNHYLNRKFYLNFLVNLNLLKSSVDDIKNSQLDKAADKIFNRFFVNYEVNTTGILFRRFHLSLGLGLLDFASLVKNTSTDLLSGSLPNLDFTSSITLKLYLFQIKY